MSCTIGSGRGKPERDVFELCNAAAVKHHITGKSRIGALEKSGHAHGKRIDRA
jgi:hypothetical protein